MVVIDEAQNLTPAVLEQIRLLTNLETNEKKLLRIILLGQPELVEMLDKTELRQLSQRITARYHLAPLSKPDTTKYVTHRLAQAGGNPDIFTQPAISRLYRLSGGIPRLINIITDRAMLGAYVKGEHKVSQALVQGAAKEVFGSKRLALPTSIWTAALVGLGALMLWAGISKYGGGLLEQLDNFSASTNSSVVLEAEPSIDVSPELASPASITINTTATKTNDSDESDVFAPITAKPVVVELWDDASTPYYGAIIGSSDGRFQLQIGEQSLSVQPRDLRDAWFGSYVLLWQTPPNYRGSLREGDQHASVLRVRSTLADLHGTPDSDSNSTFFDVQLHEQVLAFQHDEGLLGDGVVGPLTWINLNRHVNNNGPKLSH